MKPVFKARKGKDREEGLRATHTVGIPDHKFSMMHAAIKGSWTSRRKKESNSFSLFEQDVKCSDAKTKEETGCLKPRVLGCSYSLVGKQHGLDSPCSSEADQGDKGF